MRNTGNRTSRSLSIIVLAAGALLLLLFAAAPALAADGVQVWAGKDMASAQWQGEVQMAGNYVVWTQKVENLTADGYQYQVYLADVATGAFLQLHPDMAMEQHVPHVAVQDGLITVVWNEDYGDEAGYHSHLWIWQGTEPGGTHFVPTPDPSAADPDNPTSAFPRYLVMGKIDYSSDPAVQVECNQSFPSLGLVAEPQSGVAGDHLVVAWEDTRDYGADVPQIYYADLTSGYYVADSMTQLWDTGSSVDLTDMLARGEHSPSVGPKGVFWLDDRYSIWSPGQMTATDVRFSNFAGGGPDMTTPSVALYNDVPAADDNDDLVATGAGAAWLHSGPYPNGAYEPLAAKIGGTAAQLATAMLPSGYQSNALSCSGAGGYYAFSALHADAVGGDPDIFFFDPATGSRVPVCDRGATSYPDTQDGNDNKTIATQVSPAISLVPDPEASSGALPFERVLWTDGRVNAKPIPDEQERYQLFEAFVPHVAIKAGLSLRSGISLKLGKSTTISATVSPNFGAAPGLAGAKVTLQLVKVSRPGIYTVLRSKYSSTKALSSSSTASWTFKPTAKGTYLVRIYFAGGTRYYSDGTLTGSGSGFDYKVPHVPNDSRVVKVVVK